MAPGIKEEPLEDAGEDEKPSKRKTKTAKGSGDKEGDSKLMKSTAKRTKAEDDNDQEEVKPPVKRAKAKQQKDSEIQKPPSATQGKKAKASNGGVADTGRRRSARLGNGA